MRAMLATKARGEVTAGRKLIVDFSPKVVPGVVEVILLQDSGAQPAKPAAHRSKHPAFGVWADHNDIASSTEFPAKLRRRL
jgi:hypothetical protein